MFYHGNFSEDLLICDDKDGDICIYIVTDSIICESMWVKL